MAFEEILDIASLEERYTSLISDDDFDEITLSTNQPNIFRIIGATNQELKHSNFLGWLLQPNESHGLNDYFLRRVLQDLLGDEKSPVSILELGGLDFDSAEVRREWKNIDLLILFKDIVICIENKIWSGESKNQLVKYQKIIEKEFLNHKKVFVYLTPYGIEPSNDIYIPYSYQRIIEILENILNRNQQAITGQISQYLNDYISILKQSIMNESSLIESAKKLYKNHKELFDFVFEHKPDYWDVFGNILRDKVKEKGWILGSKNKGYVRFWTPALEPYMMKYNRANGWPEREAFLFEFEFYHRKKLTFKPVISPPKDFYEYDEKLVKILNELEDANKNLGAKWKVHFYKNLTWDFEKVMHDWDETHEEKLDEFIEKEVVPLMNTIEKKILEHKDELKTLKLKFEND